MPFRNYSVMKQAECLRVSLCLSITKKTYEKFDRLYTLSALYIFFSSDIPGSFFKRSQNSISSKTEGWKLTRVGSGYARTEPRHFITNSSQPCCTWFHQIDYNIHCGDWTFNMVLEIMINFVRHDSALVEVYKKLHMKLCHIRKHAPYLRDI